MNAPDPFWDMIATQQAEIRSMLEMYADVLAGNSQPVPTIELPVYHYRHLSRQVMSAPVDYSDPEGWDEFVETTRQPTSGKEEE